MAAISDDTGFCGAPLACFTSVTESDVKRLVAVAPRKSAPRRLDPVPTRILKQWSSQLVPLITVKINTSLTKSIVPDVFKRAVVRQLL